MNNAPLTLILIASLGIVAVISLGVFFAVRPKFADTDEHLAADLALEQTRASSSGSSPASTPQHHESSTPLSAPLSVGSPTPGHLGGTVGIIAPVTGGPSGTPKQGQAPGPTFDSSSKQRGDQEIVSTVELLDSLRVPPGFGSEQDVRATAQFANSAAPPPSSAEKSVAIRELSLISELDMHRYGKVVGIAYRKGRLYVPSYQNGNISVYKGDSLSLIKEYSCPGCHIYDIGVLANGDMVLSQGKYSKLTRISSKTGAVVKEATVPFSPKGIAVSPYDEIFVLPRDEDSIYVYDGDLKQLGILSLQTKTKSDCNFLAYGADAIYVSCEAAAYVVDVQGKLVQTLKPSQGMYAIGVAVDNEAGGQAFIGQRGKSVIDVYDKTGTFVEAIGERKDTLWSDIAIGGKYLYVIEYITATIKQYRLH